jgi:predicted transposase/invertase (TIGR01784 family)
MKKVASLRYGVIFKKAFCDVTVFKGFVRDILGINLEIDKVETEKEFDTLIGNVKPRFDLYAEDKKNRVIVDIQQRRDFDHYDRFLHYHCLAILEQVKGWLNYKPPLAVYTIVVLTSGDKHKTPVSVIDFDPKDLDGKPLGEILHKVIYLCPKYMNDSTPELYCEWLRVIEESLSGTVDETMYHLSEVETVLHHIEQDGITPEERYWMIEEYSIEKSKQESREEGREEGELNAKKAIAKGMLAKGIDVATIFDITGLTVAQIQQVAIDD